MTSIALDRSASGTTISIFTFGMNLNLVFSTSINLGMSLLTAVAFDFADSHADQVYTHQCISNFVELERLYDCRYEFHKSLPVQRLRSSEATLAAAYNGLRGARAGV